MLRKTVFMLLGVSVVFFSGYCDNDIDEKEDIEITKDTIPYDQKLGGSGVIQIGLTKMDLAPVEKIVRSDIDKGGFNFDESTLTTIGVMGYAGQRRNGMRVGFGAWGGYGGFYGDTWTTKATSSQIARGSDSLIDSIIKIHVLFGHCGLVAERSFKINRLNLLAGGMIGGGGIIAIEDRRKGSGAFTSSQTSSDTLWWSEDSVTTENRIAAAPVWAFDLHGGFTYSFTKWLHIGLDGSSLFYYSSRGFMSKAGSFWTVNPGVKLRLVFGSST